MVRFVLTILVVLIGQVAAADEQAQPSGSENIATAERFMETVVTDPSEAKSLTHEEFEFMFMGRTRISNVPYDRTSYFDTWLPEVVAKLVLGLRRLEVVDAIGDAEGVALIAEGDADGVNGLYDNRYVFIFKFKGGKIASLREYNSDLLVATRLYKQKLVADD